jgi:hypothetical protein
MLFSNGLQRFEDRYKINSPLEDVELGYGSLCSLIDSSDIFQGHNIDKDAVGFTESLA